MSGMLVNKMIAFAVWGSSTGSAVATATNFTTFALGAETAGSLILLAVANSAASFKPSMGMVSRDGVIPQLDSQDVPGQSRATSQIWRW